MELRSKEKMAEALPNPNPLKYVIVAMILFFGMAAFLQISAVSYQEWKKNKEGKSKGSL